MWSISKSFSVLLLSSLASFCCTLGASATKVPNDQTSIQGMIASVPTMLQDDSTTITHAPQGVEFNDSKREALDRLLGNRSVPLWAGASVSVNLAGAFLQTFSTAGTYEAALRINLRNKYFPIVELGLGSADQTSETTQLHYKTSAPFGRIGLDYNLKRDKRSTSRVFVGARYGFSAFNYDLSGMPIQDTHWKTETPFQFRNMNDNVHWGELVFGLETSLWKFVHLGWSVRYQVRLYEHNTDIGRAWHVPGFGRNAESSHFTGTFQLVFDLSLFKKVKSTPQKPSK